MDQYGVKCMLSSNRFNILINKFFKVISEYVYLREIFSNNYLFFWS